MALFFIWIFLSLAISTVGINKNMGYLGALLICLIGSPLIGLIVLTIVPDKAWYTPCNYCGYGIKVDRKGNRLSENYYCPRCGRDEEGYNQYQNNVRF